jgi:hypothetical protein
MNVVGMGFGPLVVGAFSQYAFGEAHIRFALATVAALMGIPAVYVFWRGLRPYGGAVATGQPLG